MGRPWWSVWRPEVKREPWWPEEQAANHFNNCAPKGKMIIMIIIIITPRSTLKYRRKRWPRIILGRWLAGWLAPRPRWPVFIDFNGLQFFSSRTDDKLCPPAGRCIWEDLSLAGAPLPCGHQNSKKAILKWIEVGQISLLYSFKVAP